MTAFRTLVLAGGALLALGTAAQASDFVGLVDGRTLVKFNSETLSVSHSVAISGVDSLVGIDYRPADRLLYGVTPEGLVVTLDPMSGVATPGATLETMLPPGVGAIVDFNPAADRLRLMGDDGTNLRADVDSGAVAVDGSLAFDTADANAGTAPRVVAAAYTQSYGKPESTAMFDIDAALGVLIRQAPPNDGVLKTIGSLGIAAATTIAFDIETDATGQDTAWLAADGTLYAVDLASGTASLRGHILGLDGALGDIAAQPAD